MESQAGVLPGGKEPQVFHGEAAETGEGTVLVHLLLYVFYPGAAEFLRGFSLHFWGLCNMICRKRCRVLLKIGASMTTRHVDKNSQLIF